MLNDSTSDTELSFLYCPKCGKSLSVIEKGGRQRSVCLACGFVHYRNPVVGVAIVLLDGDRVLLARRARGPYKGDWCFPCGYVEWEEDVREAAKRETLEETGLEVKVGPVYAVHSNFHDSNSYTVGIWFQGSVLGGKLQAGDDVDLVEYMALERLPGNIAFPTDRLVLAQLQSELVVHR